jgi:hypothetical protein
MTPKEFNIVAKTILKDRLSEVGFKSHKDLLYLHKSPTILVLVKHYQKEFFQGFYVAMTHDFLTTVKNDAKELTLSPFLEDYPFSISVDDLESQYKKFASVKDFDYDTNFLTRVVLRTRTDTSTILSMYDKIRYNESLAKTVVNSVADKIIEFGLKLLNEYSPTVSYQSVTRHKKVNDFILERFKNEIEKYCLDNNIPLYKPKKSWFSFFK